MMRRFWVAILMVCTALLVVGPTHAQSVVDASFKADLEALASGPHRLTGSAESAAAIGYVQQRLAGLGLDGLWMLEMPVWTLSEPQGPGTLVIDGKPIELATCRPNVLVTPSTPEQGIRGPVRYLGMGSVHDFAGRSVQGAIVVLDIGSNGWRRAFARGAAAVVFLDREDEAPNTTLPAMHVGVPANLVRAVAMTSSDGRANGVDLSADHDQGVLQMHVGWQKSTGRNLIGYLRGTAAAGGVSDAQRQAVVLAVSVDSYGAAPLKSPGARNAMNTAWLIHIAERLAADRPERDVLLMFIDGQAQSHAGARAVYDALMTPQEQEQRLTASHDEESSHVQNMLQRLGSEALSDDAASAQRWWDDPAVQARLQRHADWLRADVTRELQDLRLSSQVDQDAPEVAERIESLRTSQVRWDRLREALHTQTFPTLVESLLASDIADESESAMLRDRELAALKADTWGWLESRRDELAEAIRIDGQRRAMREALGLMGEDAPRVTPVVHLTLDLSTAIERFGVVVGDDTFDIATARRVGPQGDGSHFYGQLLRAIGAAAEGLDLPALEYDTLRDPDVGQRFVQGSFVNSGAIAGIHGVYNVAVMTGHDARPLDGSTHDTVDRLDLRVFDRQAAQVESWLDRIIDEPGVAQPPRFTNRAMNRRVIWSGTGSVAGPVAGLKVVGGLSEDRPAVGAMVAMWSGGNDASQTPAVWKRLSEVAVPFYDPLRLATVQSNGRFDVGPLQQDVFHWATSFAMIPDDRGQPAAANLASTLMLYTQAAIRLDLVRLGQPPVVLPWEPYALLRPVDFSVLSASGNTEPRNNQGMQGQAMGFGFAYADEAAWGPRLKVFQPAGPVVLGASAQDTTGRGVLYDALTAPHSWLAQSAEDLWHLNEGRLSLLRGRGVSLPDLEGLHASAGRVVQAMQDATNLHDDAEVGTPELLESLAVSDKLHRPLRAALDDLVRAAVLLLLLAIPFAFALERLVISAVSIYARIGWFVAFFMATFGLIYVTHAGFSVATTPLLIFLAFAILILSTLVIVMLVRKFQAELREVQGQGGGVQESVSQVGVMLAAVGMGLSTMRRRPIATVLTTVTVTVLTFTILTFSSLEVGVGVRRVTLGPVDPAMPSDAVMLRKLDYGELEPGVMNLLPDAEVFAQRWIADSHIAVASPVTGEARMVQGVLGIEPGEAERWPALAEALSPQTPMDQVIDQLRGNGVFMPRSLADDLGLGVGDAVRITGVSCRVSGFFDASALTRLRHVDDQPVLPVDPLDRRSGQSPALEEADPLVVQEVQRDFTRLGANQIVVVASETVAGMGGPLSILTVYPDADQNLGDYADALAARVNTPVWSAEAEGLQRRVLTRLTSIAGGGVLMPLLLGSLIIFGTLMGSITDRKAEVYTFSALGLSPKHVGALFLAEAGVYAILGCMSGLLLALAFGSVAGMLARAGLVQPLAVNYASTSTILTAAAVGLSVLISAIYPAIRAGRSANPGVARRWSMPNPEGDRLALTFPFTVSSYDMTGVVSYLAEHFRAHQDAGLGAFACRQVEVSRDEQQQLTLTSELALAPFDLGVTQRVVMTAVPMTEIQGIDEVALQINRASGTRGDWVRANRTFLKHLRRQFLLWRTLNPEMIQRYRQETLEALGRHQAPDQGRVSA